MDETTPKRRGPGKVRKINTLDLYCLFAYAVQGKTMREIAEAVRFSYDLKSYSHNMVYKRLRKFDRIDANIRTSREATTAYFHATGQRALLLRWMWEADNAPQP